MTAGVDIMVPIHHWPAPALILRSGGRIVAANAAMARCLAMDAAALAGTALAAWSLDDTKLAEFLRRGSDSPCEIRFRAGDDTLRVLALSISRGALPAGDVVAAVDMTFCRAAESRLREERDRYLDMIRAGSDWFYESETTNETESEAESRVCLIRSDADGALQQYELHTKWPDALVDRSYDPEGLAVHMKRMIAHQPFRDMIHRKIDEHGNERYFRASGVPYLRDSRHAGYRGISTNVTAQVLAEQALQSERRLLEAAQRVAGYGSAARDLATGLESWSPQLCRLLDVDAAMVASGETTVASIVDGADGDRFRAAMTRAETGERVPSSIVRLARPGGAARRLEVAIELLRAASGKPEFLLMVFKELAARPQP